MASRNGWLRLYRLLVAMIFPLLAAHTAWVALKYRNLRLLRQRLGFHGTSAQRHPLWIHAASVGEVNAVLPLVTELRARFPRLPVMLSTITPTGAATACAKLPADIEHRFLPWDRRGGVERFLARTAPRAAVIVETELWPNLYDACAQRRIPLIIVNGRISPRTLQAPWWLRRLYAHSLAKTTAILARTEEDKERFVQLGAPRAKLNPIGNIKFASAPVPNRVRPVDLGRPFVLAASTRDDEERLVVEAWERTAPLQYLLVIAPRHPERLPSVLEAVRGRSVAVRSRGDAISAHTNIYVVDTLGELPAFIAGASLVVMGGSFVPKGGQNLLEPAALGKATLVGPHMENFAAETRLLLDADALVQVSLEDLPSTLHALLADDARRARLGANAQSAVEARRDIARRYVDALAPFIGAEP